METINIINETPMVKLSYYQRNKAKCLAQKSAYRLLNLEKIQAYKANWNEINQHKCRDYYQANKVEILEKMLSKVECIVCKCYINFGNHNKHERTAKHLKNLEKQTL